MPDPKKPISIPVNDVVSSDEVPTDKTSKPVIVTNRSIVKDPMFATGDSAGATDVPSHDNTNIHKTSTVAPKAEDDSSEPKTDDKAKDPAKNFADSNAPPSKDITETTQADIEEAEAARQTEHDLGIQKLIDGKDYFLPINLVEDGRSRRFIILGVVLSVVLLLVWADIALDAGIIHIAGVKPLTNFFSN